MSDDSGSILQSENRAVIILTAVAWVVLVGAVFVAIIIWTNEPDMPGAAGEALHRAETISGVAWLLGGISAWAVMLVLCEIANAVVPKRPASSPPVIEPAPLEMKDL